MPSLLTTATSVAKRSKALKADARVPGLASREIGAAAQRAGAARVADVEVDRVVFGLVKPAIVPRYPCRVIRAALSEPRYPSRVIRAALSEPGYPCQASRQSKRQTGLAPSAGLKPPKRPGYLSPLEVELLLLALAAARPSSRRMPTMSLSIRATLALSSLTRSRYF